METPKFVRFKIQIDCNIAIGSNMKQLSFVICIVVIYYLLYNLLFVITFNKQISNEVENNEKNIVEDSSINLAIFTEIAHQYVKDKRLTRKRWKKTVKYLAWQITVCYM